MILSNNSIFSLYYGASTHRASTTPSDYTKGILDGDPQQTLGSVIFCFGKIFNTNSPYVRYVLRGGLSGGTVATPTNFQPNSGWFSSNYTYSYKNELTMGLVLNPAIEFPLTRHFGLAAGGYANINPVMPVFGVDVTLIFGGVRHHLDNRARRKY